MMARLDAMVNDELERKFRVEVTKRFGGRKGDLSKALEQAIELWIKNDVVEKLKQKLLKGDSTPKEFENLVDGLKRQGKAALPALIEISDNAVVPTETEYVSKAINDASKY